MRVSMSSRHCSVLRNQESNLLSNLKHSIYLVKAEAALTLDENHYHVEGCQSLYHKIDNGA